jgi:hypothetical protein
MSKIVLPTPRIRDSVVKLMIKRQAIGRELVTWDVFGHPVCLGDLLLKSDLVFDLFGMVRTLKESGMPREAIHERLMRHVRESRTDDLNALSSIHREESWYAQNARLIAALLSYHFRDQTA